MLKNYLLVALRNLRKNPGYSFLNIAGLSVGLACSFFILLWVGDEVSYDRFHERGDRIHQVMRHTGFGGQKNTWQAVPKPLAERLETDYAEVEHAVLLSWRTRSLLRSGEAAFKERGYWAGAAFFEVFSFPLLVGEAATVLGDPDAMAISETLAGKLFGPDWQRRGGALGQRVTVGNRKDFTVRGVFADVPGNSTLQFDYVLPMEDFFQQNAWVEHWGNAGMQLYVQLQEGASAEQVNEKIGGIISANYEAPEVTVFLYPYLDLRLRSEFRDWQAVGGRIDYVRIFGVVAFFLLLIACINFMNLATARSMRRAREVGVRKSIGAGRQTLVIQFMGESLMITLLGFAVALLLVLALSPSYTALTGKEVVLSGRFFGFGLALALLTGLLAGSYPALYLSSFDPMQVLRGTLQAGRTAGALRKGLVVFQFGLSILLIAGTAIVYTQVRYILEKDLGVERENVVVLPLEGPANAQFESYRQALEAQPGIRSVARSDQSPLNVGDSTTDPLWEGKQAGDDVLFHIISAGHDFIETMGMEVVAGRAFSRDFRADTANYVINERAAQAMGLADPVGRSLAFWGNEGQIVGVVKDFHIASMYQPIEPAIIRLDLVRGRQLYARVDAGHTAEALAGLQAVHDRFNEGYPFEYEFLDQQYEESYQGEILMGRLANLFALVATFISCLGLFGLASFTAEQRRKEIGIRKVLGASVPGIVARLSRDFLALVLVAFVIAAPLAYYLIDRWLDTFSYRVEVHPVLFVVVGGLALLVAFATVAYQSIRAALADPVRSLRYE